MWLRISAIVMRYFFLHRRSVARVMEIFFWPVMNLLVWGFVTHYLKELALPKTVLFLLGSDLYRWHYQVDSHYRCLGISGFFLL